MLIGKQGVDKMQFLSLAFDQDAKQAQDL